MKPKYNSKSHKNVIALYMCVIRVGGDSQRQRVAFPIVK
jgi:hypothetical protein